MGYEIRDMGYGVWVMGYEIRDMDMRYEIWDIRYGLRVMGYRFPDVRSPFFGRYFPLQEGKRGEKRQIKAVMGWHSI